MEFISDVSPVYEGARVGGSDFVYAEFPNKTSNCQGDVREPDFKAQKIALRYVVFSNITSHWLRDVPSDNQMPYVKNIVTLVETDTDIQG